MKLGTVVKMVNRYILVDPSCFKLEREQEMASVNFDRTVYLVVNLFVALHVHQV